MRSFLKLQCLFAFAASGLAMAQNATADYAISAVGGTVFENFNAFQGTGFAPSPAAGQLNSNGWAVVLNNSLNLGYSGTSTDVEFARGTSTGAVTSGGVYAFEISPGDYSLGVQPIGTIFTDGSFTMRVQNTTGLTLSQVSLSYDLHVFNDQGRSNSMNFSYSLNDVDYTELSILDYTSPESADVSPAWETFGRATNLSGLVWNSGDYFHLRWTGDDVGGSGSRDQFAIDNISITAVPEPTSLVLVGLAAGGGLGVWRRKKRLEA